MLNAYHLMQVHNDPYLYSAGADSKIWIVVFNVIGCISLLVLFFTFLLYKGIISSLYEKCLMNHLFFSFVHSILSIILNCDDRTCLFWEYLNIFFLFISLSWFCITCFELWHNGKMDLDDSKAEDKELLQFKFTAYIFFVWFTSVFLMCIFTFGNYNLRSARESLMSPYSNLNNKAGLICVATMYLLSSFVFVVLTFKNNGMIDSKEVHLDLLNMHIKFMAFVALMYFFSILQMSYSKNYSSRAKYMYILLDIFNSIRNLVMCTVFGIDLYYLPKTDKPDLKSFNLKTLSRIFGP